MYREKKRSNFLQLNFQSQEECHWMLVQNSALSTLVILLYSGMEVNMAIQETQMEKSKKCIRNIC